MLKTTKPLRFFMPKLNLQYFSEPPADPPADPPAPEPKTYDEAYVKKLRDEAAGYRTKLKGLEGQANTEKQDLMKKVFETFGINPDPNLEFEKQLSAAQQKAQAAEQKANEKLIKAEVKYLGSNLGIVDADVAYLLVKDQNLSVKDDGSVEGVKEALEALLAEKPYLANVPGEPQPKPNNYKPGTPQKGNDPKPKNNYETGKSVYQRLRGNKNKEE